MNRHIAHRAIIITLGVVVAACSSMREGMERHKNAVAVAQGYALTIDHAAELVTVAPESVAPTNPAVIDRTIDLWTGYVTLGSEFREEDAFSGLDIEPLTRFERQQELVWLLRDDVVGERVLPDDATLREWYMREQPFTRVLASSILIRIPEGISEAETERKRSLAENLRQRILAGESFADLAAEYSEDPSTAAKGGELGWISRGQLMSEIEAALFDLDEGEISEIVRAQNGLLILTVTDREIPDFESVRESYERRLMRDRLAAVERSYIDSVRTAAEISITEGSVNLLKRFAFSSRLVRLGSAERNRVLAHFSGGALTFGDWADFVVAGGPRVRSNFAGSDSAVVVELLRRLAMNEILSNLAAERGHTLSQHVIDSLDAVALGELNFAARNGGFRREANGDPNSVPDGVDRAFERMFIRNRSVQPLDRVSPALRRNGPAILIHPYRYRKVIERLAELRAEEAAPMGDEPISPGAAESR